MRITEIDRLWFSTNPGREYRLRRQTPAELTRWPVPPHDGLTGWCIIRAEDGAVELFALAAGETWCDCDGCLEDFFAYLTEKAA